MVGLSVWVAILAGISFALPSLHLVSWALLGLSCGVAMVVGIVRNKPRHRLPWALLAISVFCLATGDFIAELLLALNPDVNPFPSLADVFYVFQYGLLALGLIGLYRLGVVRRDASGVLEALTLTMGVGLLMWVYIIGPYVVNPDLTILQKIISASYPLGDLAVLAIGAALVVSMRATPALRLFAVGILGLLAADIAYGIIQLNGDWQLGTPVDLGWVAFYLCWGLAALHPSMRELTEPKLLPERKEGEQPVRVILLGLASLFAPAVLAVQVLTTGVTDGLAIAVFSAALSLLVLARLARAAAALGRSVMRERTLRRSGGELLSATDEAEVRTIVTGAVRRLAPSGRDYRVLLDLGETAPDGEPAATRSAVDGGPAPEIVYTASLPPPVAEQLTGFEVTLRCDLPPRPGRATDTLYIAGDEALLATLQESAQVLAGQAGLTLERIALSDEIDRRNSEAYFRTLVVNTADVILILDPDERVRYASPSAADLFGTTELTGIALTDLVEPDSRDEVRRRLAHCRDGARDSDGQVWRVGRATRGEALVEATCRDLRGEPTVDGVVVTLRDVTDSRRMQDQIYRQATVDALTGLPNRSVFLDAAQDAVNAVNALSDGAKAGVIMMGLDDFKLVNNTMGHHAGDELLAAVGARFAEVMNGYDEVVPIKGTQWTVARLEADEFASCLRNVRDQATIDALALAIMESLREPFTLSQGAVTMRTSIGVAMTTGETDATELLRQVDLALSVAKDAGKGRMMQYEDSLHTLVADRMQLRGDLERALTEGSFSLKYQPIADLSSIDPLGRATRLTAGFEALVRWHHPERGELGPGTFIELAEESGLIVPLGNWVLHHAVQTAARWGVGQGTQPYISVNVSARQLRAADFVGRVLDELAVAGLPAQRLVLEITESMLAQGAEVHEQLARLRSHGIRVAIDDFGTGFSSLSYLRQLPIDVLKLDKSFVDNVSNSDDQHAVVRTVLELAQTLHLDVIAEGIETEEELHALTEMGCGFGQGYVVSHPLDREDAERRLRAETASLMAETRMAG